MPFTTPATAVAGTILTASWLNTYVRDNIAWMATDSPACRAYNSVAFSHTSSGNYLPVTLNSERFDNAAMHDTGSNTSRLTVPTGGAGKYITGCGLGFAANGAGLRGGELLLNNTTIICADSLVQGNGTVGNATMLATVYALAAADYIEAMAYQSSGGNLNITATANWTPEFWAYWYRT